MYSYDKEIIWIIGASSGIGASLAKELAKRGAFVILSARRHDMLYEVARQIHTPYALYPLDITDHDYVLRTTRAIHSTYGRIDRVIFLAAAYTPMSCQNLDIDTTKNIININLLGAFHLVHAITPFFLEQKHGHIILCGSVAGYTGLPGGQPYSSTKAAIINLAETMRAELPKTIQITLINPGFVRTELTDKNDFNMPCIISSQDAAQIIANKLQSKKFEIHFPKKFTLWLKIMKLIPYKILFFITRILR
jgi:short-subunit dehydrogenase